MPHSFSSTLNLSSQLMSETLPLNRGAKPGIKTQLLTSRPGSTYLYNSQLLNICLHSILTKISNKIRTSNSLVQQQAMLRLGKEQQCLLQPNKTSKFLLLHHHLKSSLLSSLSCCSLYQITCKLTHTNLAKAIKDRICQSTKSSPSFLMMHPSPKIKTKLMKRKSLSKVSSLLSCSRNVELF